MTATATTTTFTDFQHEFIQKMTNKSGLSFSQLIFDSLSFNIEENIDEIIREYFKFIYTKKTNSPIKTVSYRPIANTNLQLKKLSNLCKEKGFNIGKKGIILILLIHYSNQQNFENDFLKLYKNNNL
ncbi:hypothetical protein FHQ26_00485 [Testudinibacter sp. TR-2022]|uniref:hypothetical protein n=1 Tax=Testudinibacter sp. TR-2022 TaxID=2585029 RepID=UPI001119072E|nr:hypothetical protein [Testudinibacter sp. TR-2022]TNH06695.1 hypothetical protein FHQ25_12120 [Testudinibacter sp. TR-2022]TNH13013.1 hypothetical protein FHQ26_00485 [Testudinibacter sp. TR-2022]